MLKLVLLGVALLVAVPCRVAAQEVERELGGEELPAVGRVSEAGVVAASVRILGGLGVAAAVPAAGSGGIELSVVSPAWQVRGDGPHVVSVRVRDADDASGHDIGSRGVGEERRGVVTVIVAAAL